MRVVSGLLNSWAKPQYSQPQRSRLNKLPARLAPFTHKHREHVTGFGRAVDPDVLPTA